MHRRLSSTISRSKAHGSPYRRRYVRLPKGVDRKTIFVADAHRDDRKRFIVRADEKLTAFLELESAISTGLVCRFHLAL